MKRQTYRPEVLIIDDERLMISTLRRGLREMEASISYFNKPREALQFIHKEHETLKVIVTDQDMPEINGSELVNDIQSQYPHIQIIMITGKQIPKNLDRHIFDTMMKPIKLQHLRNKIYQAMDAQQ